MKLRFISLSTADYVLTYIRSVLYLLLGAMALLNYFYFELQDIHKANQLVRHVLRLEPMLILVSLAVLVGFLSLIVAIGFMRRRASGMKYSSSTFHSLALTIAFVSTNILLMATPIGEDMAVKSLIRMFCTQVIQFMVFIELVRLFDINSYLKRSLLKAQEKA